MAISAEEYPSLAAWLRTFTAHTTPQYAHLLVLTERPTVRARQSLVMAINDMIEMSADWSAEEVAGLDAKFLAEGLPTLSIVRARFWRTVGRALARGRIRGETEYYAVKNAAEVEPAEDRRDTLWALLAEYEARAVRAVLR
jgi:hypothetical protein